MLSKYWEVAVHAPIPSLLTYQSALELSPGQRVTVPLGRRKSAGTVIRAAEKPETEYEIKSIVGIDEDFLPISNEYLSWLNWVADYYLYPIGLVAQLMYPPLPRHSNRATRKTPLIKSFEPIAPPTLTDEQNQVIENIKKSFQYAVHYLFGVTGSGKTEIYLRLFEQVLKSGKQGLFLVPEISLTPQLVQRFASRFGDDIAVLHSQLTEREKTNQWWDIVSGKKKILVGARSALFCPLPNLGLIVLDEEHEPSYKQDEKLKYHARDAAIVLAKTLNCPVVLGSATPSLESWNNIQNGRFQLHELRNRIASAGMPECQVIDLREQKNPIKKNKNPDPDAVDIPSWLSQDLYLALQNRLEAKEQSALFLNRRGQAQVVLCRACGYVSECPNCDISLTLHFNRHLTCHYCDYHEDFKLECPSCKEGELQAVGIGTEQVETDLIRLFPEARIQRADRDEIQNREDFESLIQRMEANEIDILIGTQMIAKGLDFPRLTLVGLLLADIGFSLPDFRATERSFQLITQMAGRAGRSNLEGLSKSEVMIQTYCPEHPSIVFGQHHDYRGFVESELVGRKLLTYPPFGRIISFKIQSTDNKKAFETAKTLSERAQVLKSRSETLSDIEVLGPAPAAIQKLRGNFRYQLLLKGTSSKSLSSMAKRILSDESWVIAGVRIIPDIDPIHLL